MSQSFHEGRFFERNPNSNQQPRPRRDKLHSNARPASTYRGARRNAACKFIWRGEGVQLDPETFAPTDFYANPLQPRTPQMIADGEFWKMRWDGGNYRKNIKARKIREEANGNGIK